MLFSTLRVLTYMLGIVGTAFLIPLSVAFQEGESSVINGFLIPALASWTLALVFAVAARGKPQVFDARSAFGIVGVIWIVVCFFGAIPIYFSGVPVSFTDALFESVSGFTTTGASVFRDVESLPRSINLWRCETHWLGGMGVIALVVALIPLLGVGGFRLIKAEATGPDKTKFTSFVSTTAKSLWTVYVTMTGVLAALLWYFGMDVIDAVSHAFSTMGTGGFCTRNDSIASFAIPAVEWTCCAFMLLCAVNFGLYYRLITGRIREVFLDSELRAFLAAVLAAFGLVLALEHARFPDFAAAVRTALFEVAAVITTTGFKTDDYTLWCPAAQVVILLLFFLGGCSGSTSGGVKIIRWTILAKQLRNEIRRLMHPHEVLSLSLNGNPGREAFVPVAATFVFVYLLLSMVSTFFGALAGLDIFTAFSASLCMLGNIGPSFGELGPSGNYSAIAAPLKWWYCFMMLAGRLEIYTLLILIGRMFSFWRVSR
jgi:trk system potassium uptake protein TrkH